MTKERLFETVDLMRQVKDIGVYSIREQAFAKGKMDIHCTLEGLDKIFPNEPKSYVWNGDRWEKTVFLNGDRYFSLLDDFSMTEAEKAVLNG